MNNHGHYGFTVVINSITCIGEMKQHLKFQRNRTE